MTTALAINTCARGCATDEHLKRGLCNTCYQRDRREGHVEPMASAEPARDAIAVLVIAGWGYGEISRAANIDRSLISHIMRGRQFIQHKTREAICGIDPGTREQFRRTGWSAERRAKQASPRSGETRSAAMKASWARRKAKAAEIPEAALVKPTRIALLPVPDPGWTTQRPPDSVPMPDNYLVGKVGHIEADEQDWRDEAICAGTDAEEFFPEKGGTTRYAKAICIPCPVRAECLRYALDHDERFGIWGGLSERERRALKRNGSTP
jgi:WhiB family redox-sensing transcriptional regulator